MPGWGRGFPGGTPLGGPPLPSPGICVGGTSLPVAATARRSPRYPLHAELEIETPQGIVPSQVIDISRECMFVSTRETFTLGQRFRARLRLAKPLRVTCEVSRVVRDRGIGLRYVIS